MAISFDPSGNTTVISVTPTVSAPVQVKSQNSANQYRIVNAGPDYAFVTIGAKPSEAMAAIPTAGNPRQTIPLPVNFVSYLSGPPNAFISAITAAKQSATIYVTPGEG